MSSASCPELEFGSGRRAGLGLDAVAHAVAVRVDVGVVAARSSSDLVGVVLIVELVLVRRCRRRRRRRSGSVGSMPYACEPLVRDPVAVRVRVEVRARRVVHVAAGAAGRARAARPGAGPVVVVVAATATAGADAREERAAAGGGAAARQADLEAEVAGRRDHQAERAEAALGRRARRALRGGPAVAHARAARLGEGHRPGLAAGLARGREAVPVGDGREERAADEDRRDQAGRDRAREPQVACVRSWRRWGAAATDLMIRHSSSSPIQPVHRPFPARAGGVWTPTGRLFDATRQTGRSARAR